MKMDSRGRVRFGWRGYRTDVTRNGVKVYARYHKYEVSVTDALDMLCVDNGYFRKFCEACAIVARASDVPCMCGHSVPFEEFRKAVRESKHV